MKFKAEREGYTQLKAEFQRIAGRDKTVFLKTMQKIEENKKELKILLMKVKEESEKAGLKLKIKKTKTMASGPITSWQIDGETMETVTDFVFLGSKICRW